MKIVFFGLEMTWKYLSLIKEELFKIRTTMLLILFKEIACDCIFFTLYRKTSSICSTFKDRKMFKNRRVLWIFWFCKWRPLFINKQVEIKLKLPQNNDSYSV